MRVYQAHFLTQVAIATLLILICFLNFSHSQVLQTDPSATNMTDCGPRLILLAPCAPFVQGQTTVPTEQCCNNLIQVYNQQGGCLCLFLNGTTFASLPINTTLALQLPSLCSPQINPAACTLSSGEPTPTGSPSSQTSFRSSPNGATAVATTVTIAPRPSTVRYGLGKNSARKLARSEWSVVVALMCLLFKKLI